MGYGATLSGGRNSGGSRPRTASRATAPGAPKRSAAPNIRSRTRALPSYAPGKGGFMNNGTGDWVFVNAQGNAAYAAPPSAGARILQYDQKYGTLAAGANSTAGAPGAAPAPGAANPALGALGWQQDPNYMLTVAANNHGAASQRANINAQLGSLQSYYNLGNADRLRNYSRDTYDSNAALAARGIFQSGSRDQAYIQRQAADTQAQLDLNTNYGSIAQAGLARQLADVDTGLLFDNQAAELAAKQAYPDAHPAPTQPLVNGNNIPGWSGGAGWFSRGDGKWGFINAQGNWADATKAPPKGATMISNPLKGRM